MASTYTYDLTTDIGQVRFTIGDIVVNGTAYFSDQEIQYAITNAGSGPAGSVLLLDTWVRRLSQCPKITIGNYQEDWTGATTALAKLAATLRLQIDGDENGTPAVDVLGVYCAF